MPVALAIYVDRYSCQSFLTLSIYQTTQSDSSDSDRVSVSLVTDNDQMHIRVSVGQDIQRRSPSADLPIAVLAYAIHPRTDIPKRCFCCAHAVLLILSLHRL